jgi:hypothetical protein
VGESYIVVSAKAGEIGGSHFHFEAVVMAPGSDRVIMQNFASGDPFTTRDSRNKKWKFDTWGTMRSTFHDYWGRPDENIRRTIRVGTQPPSPPDLEVLSKTPTTVLLNRFQSKTDVFDRYWVKRELERRRISIIVSVVNQEDWTGSDNVYAVVSGGNTARTATVDISKGSSGQLSVSVAQLLPVMTSLRATVFDYDWFSPSDCIGSLDWPAPFSTLKTNISGDGATYTVTLGMG